MGIGLKIYRFIKENRKLNFAIKLMLFLGTAIMAVLELLIWLTYVTQLGNKGVLLSVICVFVLDVLAFAMTVYLFKNLVTEICVTDKGLAVSRFGKKVFTIPWKDVKEVGIGRTKTSDLQKIYFAKEKLNEREKSNLDLAGKKAIFFAYIDKENQDLIKNNCVLFHDYFV